MYVRVIYMILLINYEEVIFVLFFHVGLKTGDFLFCLWKIPSLANDSRPGDG